MNNIHKYLEIAKAEEVASQLEEQGYTVDRQSELGDVIFDLLAKKDDHFVAYEITARATIPGSMSQMQRLRDTAQRNGYEFRMIIVVPPHEISVEVDDLEENILDHVVNNVPDKLAELSTNTCPDSISDLEFDVVRISKGAIYIQGTGSIDVHLEFDGGEERDGVTMYDSYPFDFSLELDRNLEIEFLDINVNTTSFYE